MTENMKFIKEKSSIITKNPILGVKLNFSVIFQLILKIILIIIYSLITKLMKVSNQNQISNPMNEVLQIK